MVRNVHERVFQAQYGEVGDLIDGLGSEDARLWPGDRWPPLRLCRQLGVGAAGGHGPVRYRVEGYEPGRSVLFRFIGSEGTHGLQLTEAGPGTVRLRHELVMKPGGFDRLLWALVGRPLHDALAEDALDRAQAYASAEPVGARAWSWRVRLLRRLLGWSGDAAPKVRGAAATVGGGGSGAARSASMLLDEIMPEYEFNEVHRILVDAPPEETLEAVRRVTPGEMPLVRLLFAIRSLPAIFSRGGGGLPTAKAEPLYRQMLAFGFVLLAEEPGREVVAGEVGQPWRLGGGSAPAIRDAREFVAFEEKGYMKAAMNFSVEPESTRTELRTEDAGPYHRSRRAPAVRPLLVGDLPRQRRDPQKLARSGKEPGGGRSVIR